MRLVLVLSAVVVLGVSAGTAQQRDVTATAGIGTSEIAGKVVDAATGSPLARARVNLQPPGGGYLRVTLTDGEGRFVFPQLPAGSYVVEASLDAYLSARFGQRKIHGAGTPIVVADRQKIENLTVPLVRGGVLTGLAIDSLGKPLVRATVQALRWQYTPNGPALGEAASATTDDRGQYRIFALEPGDYLVRARPRTESQQASTGAGAAQPAIQNGVAPSFFPSSPVASQASTVRLAPGEERTGLDVVVPLVPLATLSGTATTLAGQPVGDGSVRLIPDADVQVDAKESPRASIGGGRFSFAGVGPGSYVLTAIASAEPGKNVPGSLLFAVTRVSVAGRDVNDVSLVLQHGVTVSGRLKFVGTGKAPDPTAVNLSLVSLVNVAPYIPLTRADAQARFTLTDVGPGAFRLDLFYYVGDWVLQSVALQGRELLDLPFEVGSQDISDVELTLTNATAQVAGTISDNSGHPIADASIVLFPADKQLWASSASGIKAVQSDANGGYQLRRSRAGDFLIAAVDDVEPNQWFDPRFLERIADKATRVKLSPNDRQTIDLRVVSVR